MSNSQHIETANEISPEDQLLVMKTMKKESQEILDLYASLISTLERFNSRWVEDNEIGVKARESEINCHTFNFGRHGIMLRKENESIEELKKIIKVKNRDIIPDFETPQTAVQSSAAQSSEPPQTAAQSSAAQSSEPPQTAVQSSAAQSSAAQSSEPPQTAVQSSAAQSSEEITRVEILIEESDDDIETKNSEHGLYISEQNTSVIDKAIKYKNWHDEPIDNHLDFKHDDLAINPVVEPPGSSSGWVQQKRKPYKRMPKTAKNKFIKKNEASLPTFTHHKFEIRDTMNIETFTESDFTNKIEIRFVGVDNHLEDPPKNILEKQNEGIKFVCNHDPNGSELDFKYKRKSPFIYRMGKDNPALWWVGSDGFFYEKDKNGNLNIAVYKGCKQAWPEPDY